VLSSYQGGEEKQMTIAIEVNDVRKQWENENLSVGHAGPTGGGGVQVRVNEIRTDPQTREKSLHGRTPKMHNPCTPPLYQGVSVNGEIEKKPGDKLCPSFGAHGLTGEYH